MKIILTTLILLALSLNVYALDFSTINDESIKVFMELLPQYRQMAIEFGQDLDDDMNLNIAEEFKVKMDDLFGKFGITPEEFGQYMQRITMGFAALQMEEADVPDQAKGFMNMFKMPSLPAEEMSVIKNNFDQLKEILSDK